MTITPTIKRLCIIISNSKLRMLLARVTGRLFHCQRKEITVAFLWKKEEKEIRGKEEEEIKKT